MGLLFLGACASKNCDLNLCVRCSGQACLFAASSHMLSFMLSGENCVIGAALFYEVNC